MSKPQICGMKQKQNDKQMEKIDYCRGSYYNFKKGDESCQNKQFCRHYKHYLLLVDTDQPYYEMPCIRFAGIKFFRNCKLYKTN